MPSVRTGGVEVKVIREQLVAETVGLFDSPWDALAAAVEAQFKVCASGVIGVASG